MPQAPVKAWAWFVGGMALGAALLLLAVLLLLNVEDAAARPPLSIHTGAPYGEHCYPRGRGANQGGR